MVLSTWGWRGGNAHSWAETPDLLLTTLSMKKTTQKQKMPHRGTREATEGKQSYLTLSLSHTHVHARTHTLRDKLGWELLGAEKQSAR